MRILHIISTVRPEAGGTAEAVRMMVEARPAGVEIGNRDCGCSRRRGLWGRFPALSMRWAARGGYWYSAALVPWLKVNRERFDGVIVHGLWNYVAVASCARLRGRSLMWCLCMGCWTPISSGRFR